MSLRTLKYIGNYSKRIRTLAFGTGGLDEFLEIEPFNALLKFTALEEIILITDRRPRPRINERRRAFATIRGEELSRPMLESPRYLHAYHDAFDTILGFDMECFLLESIEERPKYKRLEHVKIYHATLDAKSPVFKCLTSKYLLQVTL